MVNLNGQHIYSIVGDDYMSRRGDNIHKRSDGRWEGRYRKGNKDDGTPRYISVYAKSYSECKEKLYAARITKEHSEKIVTTGLQFKDVLFKWLSNNKIRLKGGTEVKYRYIIENHINPGIGNLHLSKIDSFCINSFLEQKLMSGGIKNNEPLSAAYVRTMAIIISAALDYAVTENLCLPLKTPIKKPQLLKKDVVILNKKAENEFTALWEKETSLTALGILLALQAGLRIGEVCALAWEDVDFDNDVIHIRKTVARVASQYGEYKTQLILDTPKTNSSMRDIPMTPLLRTALFEAYKKRISNFVVSSSAVFVGTRTFDYRYRQLLKKQNLLIVNFHTLRHTYATRCAEAGMDAKTLSRLLGHSSSNTSLNLYVHPTFESAKKLLGEIFGKV